MYLLVSDTFDKLTLIKKKGIAMALGWVSILRGERQCLVAVA
jgi:hypothetical protein